MSFISQIALAKDSKFISRVEMALIKSAIAIANEDPTTPGHVARAQWATQVLRDPDFYAARVALGVASNAVITTDSTDDDIEFTVSAQWNAFAGVTQMPGADYDTIKIPEVGL